MPIRDMEMYGTSGDSTLDASSAGSTGTAGQVADAEWELRQRQGASTGGMGLGVPVAANRGASGIDGVLSTAAGFAEGLARPATLVVGDLSFLHDINGLCLLRGGEARPPLTVVLVNNGGGGIFSFLPIAGALPKDTFTPLWETPQNVDLEGMCRAHGIPHQRITTAAGLGPALTAAWGLNRHSVVEVVTDRASNVELHKRVQARALAAAQRTHWLLTAASGAGNGAGVAAGLGALGGTGVSLMPPLRVQRVAWRQYALPLAKPLTTSASSTPATVREGALVYIEAAAASGAPARTAGSAVRCVGEVAPLPGVHRETLQEALAQLAAVASLLHGVEVPRHVAMLGGRLERWLAQSVGLDPAQLFPSVRFGLESAILGAIAAQRGIPLSELLALQGAPSSSSASPSSQQVCINGLVSAASAEDAVGQAQALKGKGFSAVKVKVARSGSSPEADAAMLLAVREAVGPAMELRADANRGWELEEALRFGAAVQGAALSYVEEPTRDPRHMTEFSGKTGIPVAVDESLDEGGLRAPSSLDMLAGASWSHPPPSSLLTPSTSTQRGQGQGHGQGMPMLDMDAASGLAAVVAKPSVLGSFEAVERLAVWARKQGAKVVISSAFESSVGTAVLTQLAAAVDAATSTTSAAPTCHGLGTLSWFKECSVQQPLAFSSLQPATGCMGCTTAEADAVLRKAAAVSLDGSADKAAGQVAVSAAASCSSSSHQVQVEPWGSYTFHVLDVAPSATGASSSPQAASSGKRTFVFLHGFLGCGEDWAPLMQGLAAAGHRCVAIDLPGHGKTVVGTPSNGNGKSSTNGSNGSSSVDARYSLPTVSAAVAQLMQGMGLRDSVLVGYSLGARVALTLAASHPGLVSALVSIGGMPGLKDAAQAASRAASDDLLATALQQGGLPLFLDSWYAQPMWATLRRHPRFASGEVLAKRATQGDAKQLAAALRAMSTGRMEPLWGKLKDLHMPVLLLAGASDKKFVELGEHMLRELPRALYDTQHGGPVPGFGAGAGTGASGAEKGHEGVNGSAGGTAESNVGINSGGVGVQHEREQEGGSGSTSCMHTAVRRLQAKGAACYKVPGSGHAVHTEQPLLLLQCLLEAFL